MAKMTPVTQLSKMALIELPRICVIGIHMAKSCVMPNMMKTTKPSTLQKLEIVCVVAAASVAGKSSVANRMPW